MTEPPFLPGPTVDDGLPPSFDEYRWSQLIEENKHIISVLKALKVQADNLEARFEAVRDTVGAVNGRLDALEAKDTPPTKPADEVNEQIVAFLESAPDIKLTAISIRENLGIDAKYIHDRCKTLVRQNRIRMHVVPGRHPFYQALPRPIEPTHPA